MNLITYLVGTVQVHHDRLSCVRYVLDRASALRLPPTAAAAGPGPFLRLDQQNCPMSKI